MGNHKVNWKDIVWKKFHRHVYRLQKRIFKASQRGDVGTMRRLQKLLMKSFAAKCLAVRRVTQDNQGKSTAGVDGKKSLTPNQRLELVATLKPGTKAKATRRVMIPKPGKAEKRPLGIPTMSDRALQCLVKLALEPEWEARFEENSYGFRPGRSCHDAIQSIFISIAQKPKYVFDADISKCFDRIDHKALLHKLNTFPALRRQVKSWLKAGYILNYQWEPTHAGTPQGGVISPLLANIALHGMEQHIRSCFKSNATTKHELGVVRYADDFVILHKDLKVLEACIKGASEFLASIGLELHPDKTRVVHTLINHDNQKPGFNFLGFNICQHKIGKHQSKQGFVTLIKPQKEKVQAHHQKLADIIVRMKAAPQSALIGKLNPIIRGWSNYYSAVVSKETFGKLDHLLNWSLRNWGKRRHASKTGKWVYERYWHRIRQGDYDAMTFSTSQDSKNPCWLLSHARTPIVRHKKVKGAKSPFDGDLIYWSTRLGEHPEMDATVAKLLKRQDGKCAYCRHNFMDGDLMEKDHTIEKRLGGKNSFSNLQLLHRHCHDKKTAMMSVLASSNVKEADK
ncbi:group II intron reverse transcriptase/maturase [[Phormidium ambiguum] IAM M-71]|uniref:group II intron reverse transcriptase/maturase n=1 Tax=[Phormidium ambiguum] IAM M-71 TaxID=454136 RepID=UPI0009FD1049|nr:group II intron reverse transcriptase/maturase [Phormidium ambiguum]